MNESPPESSALFRLFLAKKKSDFTKIADQVTLSFKELDQVARFSSLKTTPLRHMIGSRISNPTVLTANDWVKIQKSKKSGKLLDAINQHSRTVFYAFWLEITDEEKPWWLISYSLRDRQPYENHWSATGSPHAHMISYLTHPRDSVEAQIKKLADDPAYDFSHRVHIRFENDGWEDIAWG